MFSRAGRQGWRPLSEPHLKRMEIRDSKPLSRVTALRRPELGRLTVGARADAVILAAPSYTHLVYRPGVPLVAATIVGGRTMAPR